MALRKLLAVCLVLAAGCSSADEASPEAASGEDALIGGTAERRWQAVGYLTRADGRSGAVCGATLIAPNVAVTAAHCVYRNRATPLAFGVGELGDERRFAVREIHYHPKAHLEADGSWFDPAHALRLFDLAYVILARPAEGVAPAQLPSAKPERECGVSLVGYGTNGDSNAAIRKSVEGCVVLNANLHGDSIVEIRPTKGGAVCHRDGDEGHAAVVPGAGDAPVLLGVYVGSVTQSFSDCRKYLQYLNGYEATAGHREFYAEAIRAGAAAR